MIEKVRAALARQKKNGTVTGEPGAGGPFEAWLWRVAGRN